MKVFSRKRCGLAPPKESYTKQRVTFASIHHGGPVGGRRMTFKYAAQTWRDFQHFHQNVRGWNDIGYHVGVDGLGRLYAGRPVDAVPAAVENHNTGSIGVVFLQDGRRYRLNLAQRRTLRILFEKGEPKLGIPPLKFLPGGVKAHREFSGHETNECPGHLILRHLKWRRSRY